MTLANMKVILILFYQMLPVFLSEYNQPVAKELWSGICSKNSYALNDCNWCKCNEQLQYMCKARDCNQVDVFGHFNDAIRDIDVGMEGHGAWRSTQTVCEPGMRYQRDNLLCICTEDGTWPNPTCRDVFQVLYKVKPTLRSRPSENQICTPTKLYLLGCNVCYCPAEGRIDPSMCTRKQCNHTDPVVQKRVKDDKIEDINEVQEIYAQCIPRKFYKWACRTCTCLTNNRLVCNNCTKDKLIESFSHDSFCNKEGVLFNISCNTCYCTRNNVATCTVKKCLAASEGESLLKSKELLTNATFTEVAPPHDNYDCVAGTEYINGCRKCYCFKGFNNETMFYCDFINCTNSFQDTCVLNTVYEVDCLICRCDIYNGKKVQFCHTNTHCDIKGEKRQDKSLGALHGYCEPLHEYQKDCNTCKCMSDGKTVLCTTQKCKKPVQIDLIPVNQEGPKCPPGKSYKVDCNLCFCLSNGNALCTTRQCIKQ